MNKQMNKQKHMKTIANIGIQITKEDNSRNYKNRKGLVNSCRALVSFLPKWIYDMLIKKKQIKARTIRKGSILITSEQP